MTQTLTNSIGCAQGEHSALQSEASGWLQASTVKDQLLMQLNERCNELTNDNAALLQVSGLLLLVQ